MNLHSLQLSICILVIFRYSVVFLSIKNCLSQLFRQDHDVCITCVFPCKFQGVFATIDLVCHGVKYFGYLNSHKSSERCKIYWVRAEEVFYEVRYFSIAQVLWQLRKLSKRAETNSLSFQTHFQTGCKNETTWSIFLQKIGLLFDYYKWDEMNAICNNKLTRFKLRHVKRFRICLLDKALYKCPLIINNNPLYYK